MKPAIKQFDNAVIAGLQRLPLQTAPMFQAATDLASGPALVTIGLITIVVAMVHHHPNIALAMVICLIGGGVANLIKILFRRPRPVTAYLMQFNVVTHYSFPSGHSASSLLVYGLLATLSIHLLSNTLGNLLATFFAASIALIGASRVYLGAHFPSDVVGGWIFGGVVLLATIRLLIP